MTKHSGINIYADYLGEEKQLEEEKSKVEELKAKAEEAKKAYDKDPDNSELKAKAEEAKKAYDKASEEVKTAEDKLNEKKSDDNKSLSEIIEKITSEFITDKPWSKTNGIKNFAILDPKLNLLQAKEKMEKLAPSEKMLLSVRGFVIDSNKSKIIAVINFANLTRGLV